MGCWDWLESWLSPTTDWPSTSDASTFHESPVINPATGLRMQDDSIFWIDTDGNRYGFYDDRFIGDDSPIDDGFNSFNPPWDTHQ